jgi:FkbM family methyltransferase
VLTERVAHWEWMLRKRRAQIANVVGRPFTYRHRLLGRFVYHPSDDLSRYVLLYAFEEPELQFAILHAKRGGTIVDVGANIGIFTAACARAASGIGQVIALEPSPSTFAKLRVTCARLGLRNVELLQIAAADENGQARFVAAGIHELRQHLADARADNSGPIEVETRRLDDVCGDRVPDVTLLKVDVEGHEVQVLSGASRILANGRVHLIVEVNPHALEAAGASVAGLQQLLTRTHECTTIIRQDGTSEESGSDFIIRPPHEMLNTFWAPLGTVVPSKLC